MTLPAATTNGPSAATKEQPIDVLLIGLGSIGAVFAYILERTGKVRVTAVARSNYKLYASGSVTLAIDKFDVKETWKPYRVVSSQAEALADGTQYAYGLITTKCLPDVLPTTELAKDALASGQVAAWSLIQNGLGVEEDLYKALGASIPIISSLAWIGIITNPEGSEVAWRGGDALVSGIYPPPSESQPATPKAQQALEQWVSVLAEGGSNVSSTENVVAVRFSKNVWNCAWSSVQGLARTRPASFGILPDDVVAPIKTFIREIVDVGFAAGYLKEGAKQYPGGEAMGSADDVAGNAWSRIVEMSLARRATGGGHKMSLWVDVEMGRPIEVEVITGAVSRLAKEVGVATPLLDYTYALMRGLQVEILQQIEAKKVAAPAKQETEGISASA